MPQSLVDTNILIYSHDLNAGEKRRRSVELIEELAASHELSLSAQCLNEFSAVSLRHGVSIPETAAAVARWRNLAKVLPLTAAATELALRAVAQQHLSFWDALIWAVAREAGIKTVYTEDFQHGREIEGVRFVNPFFEQP